MPASTRTGQDQPSGFERFQALVLRDAALQAALGEVEDAAALLDRAVAAARACAIDLDAEALARRLAAPEPPPVLAGLEPGPGWLPVDLSPDQDTVAWAWFGRRRLTEPFFADSVGRAQRQPFNRLFSFRTPLAALDWAARRGRRPDGLIFHMSRCGSTLAAQMLGGPQAHIVVSEAAPIDAAVQWARADPGAGDAAHVALLRAIVGAMGQARDPGQSRYVVKLDSWHALALPLFRRAFPDTPWVFLYRDPLEVMVSQARQRGMQMVPAFAPPALYGLDLPGGVPDEDYWARVLAAVCDAALDGYAEGGGLLVNYAQLPGAVSAQILPHFGIAGSPADRVIMDRIALRDAKAPSFAFAADSDAKRRAATAAVRTACARRLDGVYARLEALRTASPASPRRGRPSLHQ
ncbi:aspartyl beta-hydroxylase [Caulobacter sp. LARHSG274]